LDLSLEISNLSFNYGSKDVLRDVSLKVDGGEVLALIGPNGSGKSTLLKCVVGVLKPLRGKIAVGGVDLSKLSERERARLVGYLPQYLPMVFPVTVFECILLGRLPSFWTKPGKRDFEAVQRVLQSLNLTGFADKYIDEMSGGERQRVHIARVLAQEARVMLFDEPTANLDLKYQLDVMELIRKASREKEAATIIALHEVNLALKYADRVAVLNGGEMVCEGRPEEVITREMITRVYEVKADVVEYDGRPRVLL